MKTFARFAAAAAAARDQAPAQQVDIHDLDRQQDADEIDRRIAQAARRVCGTGGSRTLTAYVHVQTCRAEAIERARAR
jgi:UrcA family protein